MTAEAFARQGIGIGRRAPGKPRPQGRARKSECLKLSPGGEASSSDFSVRGVGFQPDRP